jgi:hypothetical protein
MRILGEVIFIVQCCRTGQVKIKNRNFHGTVIITEGYADLLKATAMNYY